MHADGLSDVVETGLKVRDEIRLIGPNRYLGVVYWGKKRLINFALEF